MIDRQTHDDVVSLIRAELDKKRDQSGYYTDVPERLACLVEGRLGHETPKKPTGLELPPTPWEPGRCGGEVHLLDAKGWSIFCWLSGGQWEGAFMKLVAAAPDLFAAAEAVAKVYLKTEADVESAFPGAGLSRHLWGENSEYENLIKALKKAGVTL